MSFDEGGKYADNGEIRSILIGGVIVILVLFGITGWQSNSKKELATQNRKRFESEQAKHPFPDISTDPDATQLKVNELAMKCKGDLTNLSVEEYSWLQGASAGHVAEVVSGRYKLLMKQEKEGKKRGKKPLKRN